MAHILPVFTKLAFLRRKWKWNWKSQSPTKRKQIHPRDVFWKTGTDNMTRFPSTSEGPPPRSSNRRAACLPFPYSRTYWHKARSTRRHTSCCCHDHSPGNARIHETSPHASRYAPPDWSRSRSRQVHKRTSPGRMWYRHQVPRHR